MRAKIAVWTNREIVSSIMKTIMVTLETLALTDLLTYIEGQTLFKFANKLLLTKRYLSRIFDCLAQPNLSATLATDQK